MNSQTFSQFGTPQTLLEVVQSYRNLSSFASALRVTGLNDRFNDTSYKNITVFVPSNMAFVKVRISDCAREPFSYSSFPCCFLSMSATHMRYSPLSFGRLSLCSTTPVQEHRTVRPPKHGVCEGMKNILLRCLPFFPSVCPYLPSCLCLMVSVAAHASPPPPPRRRGWGEGE